VTVNASAPVRLDFAGGWTDVAPFATRARGVVANAAIGLRAQASLTPGGEGYRLEARDLGQTVEVAGLEELVPNGELDLLKAAVRMYRPPPCRLTTRSDAPPGSGLGTSGAMGVALVAAFEAAAGRTPPGAELAEHAWKLEAVEAGLPGGKQDQYAAALGGFQRLEFTEAGVRSRPIALPPGIGDQLAERLVVCYTGQSRVSGATIARVMARYADGDDRIVGALTEMAIVAETVTMALEEGDVAAFGLLLTRNWALQQQLDEGIRTPAMARLEEAVAAAGVVGGKAAGAGAGGTMFFLADRDYRVVTRAAREAGATVLPLAWSSEGVRVW
jgi:D-glycero-alpha-D-manno-heptose-7-phosphate kinase